MSEKSRWEKRKVDCEETGEEANLLIEYRKTGKKGKKEEVGGVSCDNPQLTDYDGDDCEWTCIDEIEREKKEG
jgi:hypothetical protein